MNEILFFFHVLLVVVFILIALRVGKEALISFFALQVILANLLVFKQIHFFGLTVTCTETLTIGSILTLNLIQEYFGKKSASKAIAISFLTLFLFAVMSQLHLLYRPSEFDTAHLAYRQILSSGPRIIFASLAVTLLVQKFDVMLYGYLRKKIDPKRIIIRNFGSMTISQLIDTVLFSFVGLYGLIHNIWHVIVASYLIKMIVIFSMSPFTALTKRFMKHDPTLSV